jgi:hypothetical protein
VFVTDAACVGNQVEQENQASDQEYEKGGLVLFQTSFPADKKIGLSIQSNAD